MTFIKVFSTAFACWQTLLIQAQLQEPGPVNMLDLNVKDEGQSAVYLINDAHTELYFDKSIGSFVAKTEHVYRIKILSSEALDLGNVKLRMYKSGPRPYQRQYIQGIQAASYNFDIETSSIEKSELKKSDIFKTQMSENWRELTFAIPNVRINSVIEFRYTKIDPYYSQLDDWFFQKDHPVLRSRYSVKIAAFLDYVFQLQGPLKPVESNAVLEKSRMNHGRQNYQDVEAFWLMEHIPAFKAEPLITSREDHISKLIFQLQRVKTAEGQRTYVKSWEDVTKDLKEADRFNQFYTFKKDFTVFELSSERNQLKRAQKIYSEFKKHFAWDNYYDVYPDISIREMMIKKSGNTASMGLMLYMILKKAGLDAKPVLFSPRSNGKVRYDYPFLDKLIATVIRIKIEGDTYLLDPVNDMPFGYLHQDFLNGKGLVLGQEVEWEDLTLKSHKRRASKVDVFLYNDSLNINVLLKLNDYGMVPRDSKVEELFSADWDFERFDLKKDHLTEQQFNAKLITHVPDDLIAIPLNFDQVVFEDNPFEDPKRLNAIDFFYKKKLTFQFTLEMTDKYEVEYIPENRIVRTSDNLLNVSLSTSQVGSKINVTFLFWTRTNSFEVQYYPTLIEAYDLMQELKNTTILIKKKSDG